MSCYATLEVYWIAKIFLNPWCKNAHTIRQGVMKMNFNKKKAIPRYAVPENSSMAKDMAEVKELGREMEKMQTNKELKEEQQLDSDPKQ